MRKLNEMAQASKAKSAQNTKDSGKNNKKIGDKEEEKSSSFFGKTDDIHSLPGKVSFLGKFFAFFTRIFTKMTMWVSGKIFGRMFSSGKLPLGFLRKYFDQIKTKALLLLGGIVAIIIFFKSIRGYIKNRKFRKKDREIEDLKVELREMKKELETEIKYYRDSRKEEKK